MTERVGQSTSVAGSKSAALRDYLDGLLERELAPHARMPTERALAEQFSVNRLTVRQVLQRLEQEGRIYRSQGSGTFVAEPHVAKSLEFTSFTSDMISRGVVPGTQLLAVTTQAAGAKVGFSLSISPRDIVVCLDRLRLGDGRPMCVERTYHPADLVPGMAERDLTGSLYDILTKDYGITLERAHQSIRATVLTEEEAKLLETAPFSPALHASRIVHDQRGRVVEFAKSIYRGDRYTFDFNIYRSSKA